jgi:hypothetical protein
MLSSNVFKIHSSSLSKKRQYFRHFLRKYFKNHNIGRERRNGFPET